jgi:hypothetical protein
VSEALRYGTWEGMHDSGLTWEELHETGATWEELLTTPAPAPAPAIVQWVHVPQAVAPVTVGLPAPPVEGNVLLAIVFTGSTSDWLQTAQWRSLARGVNATVGGLEYGWLTVGPNRKQAYAFDCVNQIGATLLELSGQELGSVPFTAGGGMDTVTATVVPGPDVVVPVAGVPPLLFAAFRRGQNPTTSPPTPSAGWTLLHASGTASGQVSVQYRVAPAPGTYPSGQSHPSTAGVTGYALAATLAPAHVPGAGSVQALNRWRRGQPLRAL